MATRISVRLDNESRQLLEDLKLRLGWSYSKIIREGILLMAAEHGFYEPKKSSAWALSIRAFPTWQPIRRTSKTLA
jgi:hypothetical protein